MCFSENKRFCVSISLVCVHLSPGALAVCVSLEICLFCLWGVCFSQLAGETLACTQRHW